MSGGAAHLAARRVASALAPSASRAAGSGRLSGDAHGVVAWRGLVQCAPAASVFAFRGAPMWGAGDGQRSMAVGKRGVPKQQRVHLKDAESKERRHQHAKEASARKATDLDRHVLEAYREIAKEDLLQEKAKSAPSDK
ncbi:hypothetical protein T484DRAFT_2027565 [Baffinella frigidus]|nr:hypothetical protein T484DRAFT_2027565 [Cryptophyta sp. CCMP2293]